MRDTLEITTTHSGYKVHAIAYYQGQSSELTVLVAWEGYGADIDLMVEFTFIEDVTVLVAIYGLSEFPELLPSSYAVAKSVRDQAQSALLLRWLGEPKELREQWTAQREESAYRAHQVNQAMKAAG